jgi:ribosomal protein S1
MAKKKVTTEETKTTHIMDSLLRSEKLQTIKKGQEIDATIVSLSKKGVLFNVGGKANAVLGDREVKEISTYLPYLKVGDNVRARVISEESKEGFPVVSMRKFFDKGKWEILKEKKEKERNI